MCSQSVFISKLIGFIESYNSPPGQLLKLEIAINVSVLLHLQFLLFVKEVS